LLPSKAIVDSPVEPATENAMPMSAQVLMSILKTLLVSAVVK
jgi:hypothetical protein